MIAGKCGLCGCSLPCNNLEENLSIHLREKHFIGYQDYCEMILLGHPTESCWKCGKPRYIISPWLDHFHLPCSCQIDPENKRGLQEIQKGIISVIQEYQGNLGRNKFYQYLVSLSPEDRQNLYPKNFKEMTDVLKELKKLEKTRIDKTQIFKVENILGTSPEISFRNLGNLRITPIDFQVGQDSGRFILGDTGLSIYLPELIPFDSKHHGRASILNPLATRNTKRLRIGDSKDCIKFYSTPNPSVRSILALKDDSGKTLSLGDLDSETQWKVRFGIIRTKELLTLILDIYNEIFKFLGGIEDSVFLLNSFEIPVPTLDMGMIFSWSWEDQGHENPGGKIIKLSIL